MIRVQLSSEKKWRNGQEFCTVPTAEAHGIKVSGHSLLMPQIAAALIAAGESPDALCEAWRGETLCFPALPLGVWASGKAMSGKQPEQLRKAGAA